MIPSSLPAQAGIGLRVPHFREMLANRPKTGWLEVHSENYFAAGGEAVRTLEALRCDYPVSLHGVGLSLGSDDPLDRTHLSRLKALADRIQPAAVSEHLCWSSIGQQFLNDLLPVPYTDEAMDKLVDKITQAQAFLGRRLLIENVSSYIRYQGETWHEWDFLAELARRADCDILLDVNNIYVSACNHGFDAQDFLNAMPRERIGEIHLAGHETDSDPDDAGHDFLIDTHSRPVSDAVWRLYEETIRRFGPVPTLIEWDKDIPPLTVLLDEAAKAQAVLDAQAPAEPARIAA